MRYTKTAARLGLSKKDFKILRLLERGGDFSTTEIALETDISRTTVAYRLIELLARDLVKKTPFGKRSLWSMNHTSNVFLHSYGQSLGSDVVIHKGKQSLLDVWKKIMAYDETRGRSYYIESEAPISGILKNLSPETLIKTAEIRKKYMSVYEGISTESILKLYKEADTSVLENNYGRAMASYIVPDEYMSFPHTVVVQESVVYVFEENLKEIVVINNKTLADTFVAIIKSLELFGTRISLNDVVKDEVKRRKQG